MTARAVRAGLLYFAAAFAAGWMLGPLRELLIVPRWGRPIGLLADAPLILGASFLAARALLARRAPPFGRGERAAMGLVALAALLAGEDAVTRALEGTSIFAKWTGGGLAEGLAGFGLPLVFAVLPLVVGRR
ncbi:hypothetical protein [Prosthecomicrobium sp. N25]|uniref:hypothetical protein n=1 Tax=Prosthecomicrobium sp. N25 TaxID=3129254 RepID=UPI0030783A7A